MMKSNKASFSLPLDAMVLSLYNAKLTK
jgi:hypothetical protein